jgi:hypothetical protein
MTTMAVAVAAMMKAVMARAENVTGMGTAAVAGR